MRIHLRQAQGRTVFSASRAPQALAVLLTGGVLSGLALFTLAQAQPPSLVFLLQAEPPDPTLADVRAEKEARVADLAARLAAGRDPKFEADLTAHIQTSQQEITEETAALGQAITAANFAERLILEQAVLDTNFAQRYFESANGRFPIPHIISINFPPSDNPTTPNSSLMPAEHWNLMPNGGEARKVDLVDDRGGLTAAQLTYRSQAGNQETPLKGGMQCDQALMRGGIRAWYNSARQLQGPPVTVKITGLHLAMQRGYQVYVYMGMGISNEPAAGAPFQISIGDETPLFGGRTSRNFAGNWVRIDPKNGEGNYVLSPLLSEDELTIEMAPVGFYPGIELGCTAINAIQLVGARPRNEEAELEELARAAVSARSAQGKLIQASQQFAATPPPAEVDPNAAARLARLAKWQERVADQIEGLRRGDYAAVIAAMQQELAEVPANL